MNIQPNGRKRGRPERHDLAEYRGLFPEWSPRTVARFAVALRRLKAMGYDEEKTAGVLRLAFRRNGSMNVAWLDEITESLATMFIARLPHAGHCVRTQRTPVRTQGGHSCTKVVQPTEILNKTGADTFAMCVRGHGPDTPVSAVRVDDPKQLPVNQLQHADTVSGRGGHGPGQTHPPYVVGGVLSGVPADSRGMSHRDSHQCGRTS